MQVPSQPGDILGCDCLEPLGLTIARAAKGLGVTRQTLSDLVNLKSDLSVEMAFRLSEAFGSSPETWLRLQMACDLWQVPDCAKDLNFEKFSVIPAG